MANPNAIVGDVVGIQPPIRGTGEEALRDSPDGFEITFAGDQTARLAPSFERAAGTLEILDELRRLGAPAYVEVGPDTGEITRLLVPAVLGVSRIDEASAEQVEVELAPSHARHVLSRARPEFDEMLATLRAALAAGSLVVVTESFDGDIVDIRPYPGKVEPPAAERPRRLIEILLRILRKLLEWWKCPSERRARQLFDLVAARSCAPLTAAAPCIPFLYPDDGCWARAQEMCRLMIAAGAKPGKVWIYGGLTVATDNNPSCRVSWVYHVAPTLCVRRGLLRTGTVAIDPSLFGGPVTRATWVGVQGDPTATLADTDCSAYYRAPGGAIQTDPAYTKTNMYLATYRLKLKNRSLGPDGPPPYTCP